ncbi:MAG: tRNA uracil 4-sulfurtransferase ThiI [Pseudohongiellaceae bacterium]
MLFVVKLFPEITIKTRPVRRRMLRMLRRNLRVLLRDIDERVTVTGEWDYLEIELPDKTSGKPDTQAPLVIAVLANTPGISLFQQVDHYPLPDMDGIVELCHNYYGKALSGKTFAVRCKRHGKHTFRSIDVEKYVGAGLNRLTDNAGVKLGAPDVTVKIEIREQAFYIVKQQYQGLGGFPLGSQDAVLSLISGGFDSSVSSFQTIRRGLLTHYCFFNLGGKAHELAVKEVALYLWMKFGASHRVRFVTVPFEEVVAEILDKVENPQMGVILKRMMLRAAQSVADKLHIQALVTGESVAQVSSQTLANLAVIDSVTSKLVLRPLVTTDKQDIIDLARRIGTEEFSKNIPEYCGVISVKPTTRARKEKIERQETFFDFTVLDRAMKNSRYQLVSEVMNDRTTGAVDIPVVDRAASGDIIVDIRHPDEEERRPLSSDLHAAVMKIPFYQLRTRFGELNPKTHYLLYCEKGMMSRLHAAHLLDEGFANVAVYAPTSSSETP